MKKGKVYCAFFTLLQAGLWGIAPHEEYFPLSSSEWMSIYEMARKQTVTGIIYQGIEQLSTPMHPPQVILYRWVVAVAKIEQLNRKMNKHIAESYTFLKKNGISPYLLKGQGVAQYYSKPLYRICGDIDWGFPCRGDYKRANKLILDRGINISPMTGFSAEYYYNEELFEHHYRMVDLYNPFHQHTMHHLIEKEKKKTQTVLLDNVSVEIPSPLLTFVQVNMHILKHFIARGIGLRQVCDSARISYSLHAHVDGEELKEIYKKIGVLRWMQSLHQMLVDDLGLPQKALPFPLERADDANWMIQEVLQAGNFGFYDQRFGGLNDNGSRKKHWTNMIHRIKQNINFAPMETLSFPVVQMYSRVLKKYYFL